MRVGIDFAREHLDMEVREEALVRMKRGPPAPALSDPGAALRAALESPVRFPPLCRALTPDDHVVIVVDEHLPHREDLLPPLLEHIQGAGVSLTSVTMLFASPTSGEQWLEPLPAGLREVHVEIHDRTERRRLAYLATTKCGRRVYLNRTAVDADQLVVLSRRGYDPLSGYSGAETALYPALSDEATRSELWKYLSMEVPGEEPWPVHKESLEVAWLLGAPFLIQVIEGPADDIAHIMGGMVETSPDGQRLLDNHWRTEVAHNSDTVVAGIAGDPRRHDFTDMARALACAARVVKPQGRIILLSRADPGGAPSVEIVRQAAEPDQVLRNLRGHGSPQMSAAFLWANAVERASVYLLSALPEDAAEDLFVTPLGQPGDVQRLLKKGGSCLFLPDAHKMMAVPPAGD